MKRTTVSLPLDLVVQLERAARRLDTSASAVVREALTEHFGSAPQGKREVPFAGLGDSGKPGVARNIDEALRDSGFGEDSFGS